MLYLASKSPRRSQLLESLGYRFQLLDLDIPEQRESGESAMAYVKRVALEKARAGFAQVQDQEGAVVLGADTEVILDDEVFGKPVDAADAASMLKRLSSRSHEVVSVVWAVSAEKENFVISRTRVSFMGLDDQRIEDYLACGEAFGKAGAYAIQGRAGAFVTHLSGSHSGVMGLPVHETAQILEAFGVFPVTEGA